MEQKLLHKMFNGEATDNELTQIRQWVNADKMNRETFYHERALFDALQLNAFQKGNHVRKQSVPLWKWIGSAAAAVIALFLLLRANGRKNTLKGKRTIFYYFSSLGKRVYFHCLVNVKIFREYKRSPPQIADKEGSLLTLCVVNSELY